MERLIEESFALAKLDVMQKFALAAQPKDVALEVRLMPDAPMPLSPERRCRA